VRLIVKAIAAFCASSPMFVLICMVASDAWEQGLSWLIIPLLLGTIPAVLIIMALAFEVVDSWFDTRPSRKLLERKP